MSCEDNFNKNSTVKNINQSFKQMEFIDLELSEVSERAILNLKNETHDKHFLDPSSNKLISVDSIILLLNYYKQIDRFTKKNSMTFWWRNRIVWQYRDTTSLLKIERLEIRDTKDSNLSIIDYNIFIQGQFDNISLRFLNKSEIVKVYYNITVFVFEYEVHFFIKNLCKSCFCRIIW